MSCLKFSLALLFISQVSFANMFSSRICLMSKYETSIEHEGKFFGLVKNKLSITKDICLIEVQYKNILETKWVVDICREPVHIKVKSRGSMDFHKRKGSCEDRNDKFCTSWNELKQILQDHGLIFADGERESLESSHGRTYCSYLLLNKYLEEGVLFSKYKTTPDIFIEVKANDEKKDDKKVDSQDNTSNEDKKEENANDDEEDSNQARF